MFQKSTLGISVLLLTVLAAVAMADDATKAKDDKPAKPKTADKESAANIAQWIKDLGSEKYGTRNEAVKKLVAAGKPVMGPVAKAAKNSDPEISMRSVSVLAKLLSSKDADTKASARKALEKLAKDEKCLSSDVAAEALRGSPPPAKAGGRTIGPGRMIINNGQGGIKIVLGGNVGAGGMMQSVTVSNINGAKETNVDENGKKTKIVENKDGITITVTDPDKNKGKPTEYKAADAKTLKTLHPEGYKIYEKHGKGNGVAVGNINIANLINARGARAPRMPEAMRKRWGRLFSENGKLVDEAGKDLDKALASLKATIEARKKGKSEIDLAELVKQIESAKKKLTEARKGLGD
jgi:hypothetical protein